MKSNDGANGTDLEKGPEKTETLPETYDAIKNASGAIKKTIGRK
jgi:hypothetical protein